MDPLFLGLSCYRRRKHKEAAAICTEILEKNPYDQSAWLLKCQSLVAQVYVDEIEVEEEGIAEALMDDNAIAQVPRPGTSLKSAHLADSSMKSIRPQTESGRPLSGVVRPTTQAAQGGSIEKALRTARTAQTARPVSAASGRHVRLGTASMVSEPDGPFINIARINMDNYAKKPALARHLFEYIFHEASDVKRALELASAATQVASFSDWWWKFQLGRCYERLGLIRDAEQQFRSSIKTSPMIRTYLHLGRVYVRLDQPLVAIDVYEQGLKTFPGEVKLMLAIARIHEALGQQVNAVKMYRSVVASDAMNIEAIACIGLNHFYSDQPELALRFYRRLLQMGLHSPEVFANIGLCCFYAQQYDLTVSCFERALGLAEDPTIAADIWYNLGHIGIGLGDSGLAHQCFCLALVHNAGHGEAYNNLGVLELRKGNVETAKAFFQTAASISSHLFEPFYNFASLAEKMGDLQSSYIMVQKAVGIFPRHQDSQDLLRQLHKLFGSI